MNTAMYTREIMVADPDTNLGVEMSVFKHNQSGGMFAIDSSFIEQEFDDDVDPIISDPFNKGMALKLIGLE